jgi:hypothetical protein
MSIKITNENYDTYKMDLLHLNGHRVKVKL